MVWSLCQLELVPGSHTTDRTVEDVFRGWRRRFLTGSPGSPWSRRSTVGVSEVCFSLLGGAERGVKVGRDLDGQVELKIRTERRIEEVSVGCCVLEGTA